MELTQAEKNFLIEVLAQVSLNYQASITRTAIIQKLSLPPIPQPQTGEPVVESADIDS